MVWSLLVRGYCCCGAQESAESRLVMQYRKNSSEPARWTAAPKGDHLAMNAAGDAPQGLKCAESLHGKRPSASLASGNVCLVMDRRNRKRFDLHAPARFSWVDPGGRRWQGLGLTRDISETGLFVETQECPPSGVSVRLEVRASALADSGLMMQTRGQVVRIELDDEADKPVAVAGFAAATRSLKLRNCKPVVTGRGAQSDPHPVAGPTTHSFHSRKPN